MFAKAKPKPVLPPQNARALGKIERRQLEFAKWLAARAYGPKPATAKSIEARLGNAMENVTNVWVDYLSPDIGVITDPIFGDDPRYVPHIIKRP